VDLKAAAMQNPSFLPTAQADTSFIQPVAKLQTRNCVLLDEKIG
jgi:hypothetical protein